MNLSRKVLSEALSVPQSSPFYNDALDIACSVQNMIDHGLEFDTTIDGELADTLLTLADMLYATAMYGPMLVEDDDDDGQQDLFEDDEQEDTLDNYDPLLEDDEDPYPEE